MRSSGGEVLEHLVIIAATACNREPLRGCRYRHRGRRADRRLSSTVPRFRVCVNSVVFVTPAAPALLQCCPVLCVLGAREGRLNGWVGLG